MILLTLLHCREMTHFTATEASEPWPPAPSTAAKSKRPPTRKRSAARRRLTTSSQSTPGRRHHPHPRPLRAVTTYRGTTHPLASSMEPQGTASTGSRQGTTCMEAPLETISTGEDRGTTSMEGTPPRPHHPLPMYPHLEDRASTRSPTMRRPQNPLTTTREINT